MALHGVALVDKPAGMSSFSVVSRIRRVFKALGVTKAGHTGTLDPLATGLLPICVGESTKFAQRLLDADKGYAATVKLGVATTTADAEGDITARSDVRIDAMQFAAALASFRGKIEQVPPIYSALKIDGKAAYEYARAGQTVEIKPRTVEIYSAELLAARPEQQEFDIVVRCSKGTYIRTLAVDIALTLGTVGHLAALRRTRTGGFDLAAARPLDDWMSADDATRQRWLLPTESLVAELPPLALATQQAIDVCNGKVVVAGAAAVAAAVAATVGASADAHAASPLLVRLYSAERVFLGLGALMTDGTLRAERLLSTQSP
jgi:tRNA pseudouridine55 synthase